jgi:hypothetical protein
MNLLAQYLHKKKVINFLEEWSIILKIWEGKTPTLLTKVKTLLKNTCSPTSICTVY